MSREKTLPRCGLGSFNGRLNIYVFKLDCSISIFTVATLPGTSFLYFTFHPAIASKIDEKKQTFTVRSAQGVGCLHKIESWHL